MAIGIFFFKIINSFYKWEFYKHLSHWAQARILLQFAFYKNASVFNSVEFDDWRQETLVHKETFVALISLEAVCRHWIKSFRHYRESHYLTESEKRTIVSIINDLYKNVHFITSPSTLFAYCI